MEFHKNNQAPTLTMGMTVYNEEKYIAESIESLLAQTYKNFVLIISDNASTDKTQQICEYYAKKDKRIIYVKHKKNIGQMLNYRFVLDQAKTPFFMLCGGHDRWHPCFVEKLLPAFREEKVVISYSEVASIDMNGEIKKISEKESNCNTTNINNPVARYLRILRFYKVSHLFFGIWRTKVFKKCNLNFETYGLDSIILEQAAFEGQFEQYKEVLFWMRANRDFEDFNEIVRRQLWAGFNKKQNAFLAMILYTLQGIKVLIDKRYNFGPIIKLWLIINVIYYKFFDLYIFYFVKAFIRKAIGKNNYVKLKQIIKHERTF